LSFIRSFAAGRLKARSQAYAYCPSRRFRRFCNRVIQQIGAGIDDLGTELLPLENAALSDEEKKKLRKKVTDTQSALIRAADGQRYSVVMQDGEIRIAKMVSFHRSRKGDRVRFEIPEESDGTQRFIDLLPAFTNWQHPTVKKWSS
jgi:uncharacterized protein